MPFAALSTSISLIDTLGSTAPIIPLTAFKAVQCGNKANSVTAFASGLSTVLNNLNPLGASSPRSLYIKSTTACALSSSVSGRIYLCSSGRIARISGIILVSSPKSISKSKVSWVISSNSILKLSIILGV